MDELIRFRQDKDAFYRGHPQSPLLPEQRAGFRGLAYFPPNPDLVVEVVMTPPDDPEPFTVGTSTGQQQAFRRAGVATFSVDGQPASLALLARVGEHGGHGLFVPFRDATAGRETYGAGRYLDLGADDVGPDGWVRLDFNYAYNPYCAYNSGYSCPLPPPDNWLDVPIRAGELAFPG
jgi:uncharacterized protein (DUF1684 family)